MALSDKHMEISRRFILHAEEQMGKGDLLQTSEKAWGATAHRLKAIASRRGWPHGGHRHYYTIIDSLSEDVERPEEFLSLFEAADSLHANFYNDFKTKRQVRTGLSNVKKLLSMLDDIERSAC